MILEELVTLFTFTFKGEKELANASRGYLDLKTKIQDVVSVVEELAAAVTGPVLKLADLGHEVTKVSERLGVGVEALQEMKIAAGAVDVSTEALTASMERLSRSAYDSTLHGKRQAEAFATLGVKVKDNEGRFKSADVLLGEVAEGLQKTDSSTKRTALALTLMGRSAGQLIPLLRDGAEGLDRLRQMARDSGAVLSQETVEGAEQLHGSLYRLGLIVDGVRNAFAAGLLPEFQRAADVAELFRQKNKSWLDKLLDGAIELAASAVHSLTTALYNTARIGSFFAQDVLTPMGAAADKVAKFFGGWDKVMLAVAATLTGTLVVAAGTALVALAPLLASLATAAAPIVIGGAVVGAGLVAAAALLEDSRESVSVFEKLLNAGENPKDSSLAKALKFLQISVLSVRDGFRDAADWAGRLFGIENKAGQDITVSTDYQSKALEAKKAIYKEGTIEQLVSQYGLQRAGQALSQAPTNTRSEYEALRERRQEYDRYVQSHGRNDLVRFSSHADAPSQGPEGGPSIYVDSAPAPAQFARTLDGRGPVLGDQRPVVVNVNQNFNVLADADTVSTATAAGVAKAVGTDAKPHLKPKTVRR